MVTSTGVKAPVQRFAGSIVNPKNIAAGTRNCRGKLISILFEDIAIHHLRRSSDGVYCLSNILVEKLNIVVKAKSWAKESTWDKRLTMTETVGR